MAGYFDRIMRAAKLDVSLYEEVEADTDALNQAIGVVLLSSVAAGIAMITVGGISGIFWGAVSAFIAWVFWAWLAYFIGTRFLPEPQTEADLGQMLRTTGFSSAPGLIRVIGIIPGIRWFIFFVASIWMLVAMIIAVRQALDYTSTLRALCVCLIGWFVQTIIFMILYSILGGGS